MQQHAPVSSQPREWPHANNQNLPQNKVLLILSGKSRSSVNFACLFLILFLQQQSPDGTVWPFYVVFFLSAFFFKVHRQCTVFEEMVYSSIWNEGLLHRNHGLVTGLIISSYFWSLPDRNGFILSD